MPSNSRTGCFIENTFELTIQLEYNLKLIQYVIITIFQGQ